MKECQHCKACYSDEVENCPKDGMPTFQSISGEPVLEGKYHLDTRVGQGGMGVVYRARHAYLKTLHAIKVILPDLVGNDPQLVTRFRQEALAAAAIRHQNVVQVTDYGVAQGTMPFLVMEFVEGESLHDLLAREKRLAPDKALRLVSAICAGIGVAHRQGIVHRDMKPLNIMLLKGKDKMSEAVKILDFGLAKIKSGELLGSFIQAQTTGLMGSPYYMAPEQWSDEDLGPQSDIYSIGVMLYQMLTGDVPFKGSSIPAIMKKHLSDTPPTFAEKGVELPPVLEQAVMRTLVKDPKYRTKSVEDLVAELKTAIEGAAAPETQPVLPTAPLEVLTTPPRSDVFLNDVAVGQTRDDGVLLLEGVQSGQHILKVSHPGFLEWNKPLTCDGEPQKVVAELRKADETSPGIPMPDETLGGSPRVDAEISSVTLVKPKEAGGETIHSDVGSRTEGPVPTGGQTISAVPAGAKKGGFPSPILLAVIGISGLLVLTAIGITGAYFLGIIGVLTGETKPTPAPTPIAASPPKPAPAGFENELVQIEGGTFKMGRDDGPPQEKPEHEVTVKSFYINKTEVTNGEYYNFVTETDYEQIPVNWVAMARKPVAGTELLPVTYVNIENIKAFAEWRSKRDGRKYRLPTEAEWEYVARNGSQGNLYPWGDEHREECAVVGKLDPVPEKVGSKSCGASERWGVQDLIGNVWEWTGSEMSTYEGNPDGEYKNLSNRKSMIVRGGSSFRDENGKQSETSTFRIGVADNLRNNRVGFRLVTEDD